MGGILAADEASKAIALLGVADESTTSRVLGWINHLGMIRTIVLAILIMSVFSVCTSWLTNWLSNDTLGQVELFNAIVVPLSLGVPSLMVLLSLLRQLSETRFQLLKLSMQDSLTGALNRRYLLAYGAQACMDAQSRGEQMSFVLLDADFFKRINDSFGHVVGDQTLRCMTTVIESILPADCAFGRYGGEEFALVLPRHDARQAQLLAEQLRLKVKQECTEVNGYPVGLTISIGVAEVAGSCNMDCLIERADQALYASKSAGRDQVMVAA